MWNVARSTCDLNQIKLKITLCGIPSDTRFEILKFLGVSEINF